MRPALTCTWKVVKIDQSMELVEKKKTFSPIWAYFGFKPTTDGSKVDETTPVCRLCKANVSTKSGNTSNLKHKHKHPQQYADIQSASTSKAATQPSIQQSFETGQPYSRNSKRRQQLTDSVTY